MHFPSMLISSFLICLTYSMRTSRGRERWGLLSHEHSERMQSWKWQKDWEAKRGSSVARIVGSWSPVECILKAHSTWFVEPKVRRILHNELKAMYSSCYDHESTDRTVSFFGAPEQWGFHDSKWGVEDKQCFQNGVALKDTTARLQRQSGDVDGRNK